MQKPLKELFAEAIAKRKAQEESDRRRAEEQFAKWVPDAIARTLSFARTAAIHGGGETIVKGASFSIPPEHLRASGHNSLIN